MKFAEACAGAPAGKAASTGYVPGGNEGTTKVVAKVPVDDVVTFWIGSPGSEVPLRLMSKTTVPEAR